MSASGELEFVHRFVPASVKGLPALLMLHGTGGDENDLLPLGQQLLPGAALLSPRGRVLENGMPRFFRRFAEGVFDLEDLKVQTAALERFIRHASKYYGIEHVIAVGYSNGANIAASVLLTDPSVLSGAVLFRAMVPFVPQSPVDLRGMSVLLTAGRRDPIIPPEQSQHLAEMFEGFSAQVKIHWHPGGHELGQDDLIVARDWLGGLTPAFVGSRTALKDG